MVKVRRSRLLAGVLIGAVAVAACTPPAATPPHASCRTLAVDTCVLPFPSDQYTVSDPTTATGVHPAIDRSLVSEGVFEALPPSFQPETLFVEADGFSPVGMVSFETPEPVDEPAVLADPSRFVNAVDRTTGGPIAVFVEVDPDGDGRLLRVWPRARWPFGHRITVSIAASLPSASGRPLARPAGWDASEIPATAFTPEDTLTTTTFTVRSESDVRSTTETMAQTAWEADHPVRKVIAGPSLLPHIRAVIEGQVRLSDFRDPTGEIDPVDPGLPHHRWVDFEIFYPEHPMRAGRAPVVLYGHGIGVFKESALVVAGDNARRGWATASIDQPNHGTRSVAEGALLDLVEPQYLGRVTSMVTQSSIDFVSFQKAMFTSMAEIDAVTSSGFFLTSIKPDGITDLDPSALIYQGTSMGGVLGAAFLSMTPEPLPAAMMQVPGVGITHILTNSMLWDRLLAFERVVPEAATPGEVGALISAAQLSLDRGDAANWIELATERGTQIMVDYGLGDGIVPNESTERLLEIAGIPLRSGGAIQAPGDQTSPDLTWATPLPVDAPVPELAGLLGHLAFLQPDAAQAQGRWMDAVDEMFRP